MMTKCNPKQVKKKFLLAHRLSIANKFQEHQYKLLTHWNRAPLPFIKCNKHMLEIYMYLSILLFIVLPSTPTQHPNSYTSTISKYNIFITRHLLNIARACFWPDGNKQFPHLQHFGSPIFKKCSK